MKAIRIGGATGFWGDTTTSVPQLVKGGGLDYLVFDYLAEITMSIMARARAKDENAGFAADFVSLVAAHLPEIARQRIKVISNAGGVNPRACGKLLERAIGKAGLDLKVAVVTGDDLIARQEEFRRAGTREMFTGEPFPEKLWSFNAYLGAGPIAAALDAGADIVITGRCVDSAVTLGTCIHAFGWGADEFDKLAAGSLAGHILECGAQASGGIHTDWDKTGDWANIGHPIAEIEPDGSFVVTKPAGTGGLVSVGTVSEQLLYEIGDPAAYLLPDVTCDFTRVEIAELGPDRVRVTGARGRRPTDTYKASATFQDGFRVGMYVTIGGIDAVAKAEKTADAVLRRCARLLEDQGVAPYSETSVEILGSESAYAERSRAMGAREVVLKLAAKHAAEAPLNLLVRELTSSGTSMAPGTAGMGGNRPKVSPVVRLFSCLVAKSAVPATVEMEGRAFDAPAPAGGHDGAYERDDASPEEAPAMDDPVAVPLVALAYGRSGDKGNHANIGVKAREARFLPYIRAALMPDVVAGYFAHFGVGKVRRYELPGIHALNFLLEDVLGGGGIASLRNDPQGKAYAQILLDLPVPVPAALARELERPDT
ncbi:acyclic terpene utilization AtuA family protein [Aliihoeflea sp. 40Bstr573]|jgi:hypothetical protein|uniref:acyclic terpene utilization AtuA family protein n=1 Tax=Aliihoeflea sp. 40Bstr573 TaxID=2696467 RepID=UPI00209421FB|nr:acyclic terpene utilization AtuA family protein [Aliihoeflea sp. 40Bstr573]MCO6388729.1 acyclic terpene utilization AtuA family protein [Aliihoeflea sp. 40Bstr573]